MNCMRERLNIRFQNFVDDYIEAVCERMEMENWDHLTSFEVYRKSIAVIGLTLLSVLMERCCHGKSSSS